MLFNIETDKLNDDESYKERNLYYKIFAGYLFNELIEIPDIDKRKSAFFKILMNNVSKGLSYYRDINNKGREKEKEEDNDTINKFIGEVQCKSLNITFDFHLAQVSEKIRKNRNDETDIGLLDDRGEMSDILLLTDSHIISIECKYLSNFTFEKDIKVVQSRIKEYIEFFKRDQEFQALQILLVKKAKWDKSKQFENHSNETLTYPLVILFWEDIKSLIKEITDEGEENKVYKYLERQLNSRVDPSSRKKSLKSFKKQ